MWDYNCARAIESAWFEFSLTCPHKGSASLALRARRSGTREASIAARGGIEVRVTGGGFAHGIKHEISYATKEAESIFGAEALLEESLYRILKDPAGWTFSSLRKMRLS